jgi:NAD-dependent dihydropyrimidine dehydrogenase PreA subunit
LAYVVGRPCVRCKYGDCVEVCPVECFYEDVELLIINPNECIDCTACEPVCPPKAITAGDGAEQEWRDRAARFDCSADKRRSRKEQVTHGPDWDRTLAGA